MTNCTRTLDKIEKKVKAGKSAEQIGKSCDMVKDTKRKAKYLIHLLAERKGVSYREYVEEHPTLGLQPQKARKTKISDKKSSDETIIRHQKAEGISITIRPKVQERLELIRENYNNSKGHSIKSDNGAIRYALEKAGLWE